MLMLGPMASHDHENPVTTISNCLDQRNVIVPLMMLLALYDAGANGVTRSKRYAAYPFICLYLRKTVIALMVMLA